MNDFPDYTSYGYRILEFLGQNGGRFTYKAIQIATEQTVIIKRFAFDSWSNFKTYEREIAVLRRLNHPQIPRYLEQFETPTDFCLIREYVKGENLSMRRNFSVEEVKHIAISVLEILVYLQAQIPPVSHRDIKPENILIDEQGTVYLIDFGLARIGQSSVAFSSAVAGTFGFMPPEQIHNQALTTASDLYSLGATLICLVTGTQSADIGSLINLGNNRLEFKQKVSGYSFQFLQWLEKMVAPDPNQRYSSAEVALEKLQSLSITLVPEVRLSSHELNFRAIRLGEKLTQTIQITNPIPDTILQGQWEVAPHRSDPPHNPDSHAWISFSRKEFRGNDIECNITVDTSKLKADKSYERKLVLRSNSTPEIDTLKIKVKTASIPVEIQSRSYRDYSSLSYRAYSSLIWLFLSCFATASLVPAFSVIFSIDIALVLQIVSVSLVAFLAGGILGMFGGVFFALFIVHLFLLVFYGDDDFFTITHLRFWAVVGGVFGAVVCLYVVVFNVVVFNPDSKYIDFDDPSMLAAYNNQLYLVALLLMLIIGLAAIIKTFMNAFESANTYNNPKYFWEIILILLTAAFGITLGIAFPVGFSNPYIILALVATGLPAVTMMLFFTFKQRSLNSKRRKLIAEYRRREEHLIEP